MNTDRLIERLWNKLDTIETKVDSVISNMVTKEDCENSQKRCIRDKTIEWSNKKLLAVGAIGTGVIGLAVKLLS